MPGEQLMLLIVAGLLVVVLLLQVAAMAQGKTAALRESLEEMQREMATLPVGVLERQNALADSLAQRVNEMNQLTLQSLRELREGERQNSEKTAGEIAELKRLNDEKLEQVAQALRQSGEQLATQLNDRLHKQQVASDERLKGLTDSLESRLGRLTAGMEEKLEGANKALREGLLNQQKVNLDQMNVMLGKMNEHMMQAQAEFGSKLEGTATVVNNVHTSLGQLAEQAKAMQELGKDIHSLQEVLMAPKLRGGLGETLLEEMLGSQLPRDFFETQHYLADGAIVDAVVKLNDKKVCVDSKFPLESFKRLRASESDAERLIARKEFEVAVRGHADSIARKYIRPDKGTFHFAMMFLPSEAVFYEVVGNTEKGGADLNQYLIGQRVIPVSPNSFMAYLQCIVLGLRGFEIQKNAEAMLAQIGQLQNQFERFLGDFNVMGKHVRNLQSKFDDTQRKAEKLGRTMSGITHRDMAVLDDEPDAPPQLEGPV